MAYGTIATRIKKLEQQRLQHVHTDSTVFVREHTSGMFDVFDPEGTGRIKCMTAQQVEARPPSRAYLFLMVDGGIYLDE